MSELTHKAFFGDREYSFLLAPAQILELERVTGTGIGGLSRLLFNRDFKHLYLTETIRLALIGGGTSPADAAALVAAYATDRPLSEIYPLAVAIIEALWFGAGKKDDNGNS